MRAAGRSLFALVATWVCSVPSSGAVLPFTGSLTIGFTGVAPFTVHGAGVATANGPGAHLETLALPASPFDATGLVMPYTDPAVIPLFAGLQLTVHNGAGTIAGGGGVIPLAGLLRSCLFSPCKIPGSPPPANLLVPLSVVGVGGAITYAGILNDTVSGAPWTVGTAAVGTVTQAGFRHGPASLTSSTAAASGQIRLVTPIFISTNIGAAPVISAFGTLDLHFVPEPGTLLLLATGILGLVRFGRARRS
jgi:hypothetical protein